MATITITQPIFLKNLGTSEHMRSGGPEAPRDIETAGQTYTQGAPLYRDANGTIAIAAVASNIVGLLLGFADAAATGVTGTAVRYRRIRPGDIFLINVKGHTTILTTDDDKVGDRYMLDVSSGKLVVNPDTAFDATKPHVVILGLYTSVYGFNSPYGVAETEGDTAGRFVCLFPDQPGLQA